MTALITVYDETGLTIVEFLPLFPGSSSVVLSEGLEAASEITKHPVERSAPMADHMVSLGKLLTLEVFVTSTPTTRDVWRNKGIEITKTHILPAPYSVESAPFPGSTGFLARGAANLVAGRTGPQFITAKHLSFDGQEFDAVDNVGAVLESIRKGAKVCSVLTSVDEENDLLLIHYRRSKTPAEGKGAVFTATFEQVTRADSLLTSAPQPAVTEPRGQSRTNKGAHPPGKSTTADPVESSLLNDIFYGGN